MQRFFSILITALLMLLSANTYANICNAGMGGTGVQQDGIGGTGALDQGIGGTGKQADGIGGTGKQADSGVGGTGIVGIVTGFASICVNGLEVFYDKQTEVDIDGVAANIDALNIGQLVAIESNSKSNQLVAQRVSIAHIMVGKIDKVDLAQNTLEVMGRTIHISPETVVNDSLKPQQLIKISGLVATNNQVHASRIDLAKADTPSQLAGLIDQAGTIHGVNIASANASANAAPTGSMVRVSGSWDGRKLIANEIKQSAIQRVLNRAENVVIQGFAANAEQVIKLHNQSIHIDKDTKISGKNSIQNQTIIVNGRLDRAGKIKARSIEYTNENKMLDRGGNKHRPDANKSSSSDERHEQERAEEVKDSTNKPETIERSEKSEYAEKANKPEKVEKLEKIEKPEKTDKSEKSERPDKVEKPEKSKTR